MAGDSPFGRGLQASASKSWLVEGARFKASSSPSIKVSKVKHSSQGQLYTQQTPYTDNRPIHKHDRVSHLSEIITLHQRNLSIKNVFSLHYFFHDKPVTYLIITNFPSNSKSQSITSSEKKLLFFYANNSKDRKSDDDSDINV